MRFPDDYQRQIQQIRGFLTRQVLDPGGPTPLPFEAQVVFRDVFSLGVRNVMMINALLDPEAPTTSDPSPRTPSEADLKFKELDPKLGVRLSGENGEIPLSPEWQALGAEDSNLGEGDRSVMKPALDNRLWQRAFQEALFADLERYPDEQISRTLEVGGTPPLTPERYKRIQLGAVQSLSGDLEVPVSQVPARLKELAAEELCQEYGLSREELSPEAIFQVLEDIRVGLGLPLGQVKPELDSAIDAAYFELGLSRDWTYADVRLALQEIGRPSAPPLLSELKADLQRIGERVAGAGLETAALAMWRGNGEIMSAATGLNLPLELANQEGIRRAVADLCEVLELPGDSDLLTIRCAIAVAAQDTDLFKSTDSFGKVFRALRAEAPGEEQIS